MVAQTWSEELTRQRIADGEYRGIETKLARLLYSQLPANWCDAEDCQSDVRSWALEAVRLYDPTRGAKFSSWLYVHIETRVGQSQEAAWAKQRTPKGRYVLRFSELEKATQSIPTTDETADAEFGELLLSLSRPAASVLRALLAHEHPKTLQRAFGSTFCRNRAADAIGVSRDVLERAVQELREKTPAFI